MLSSLRLQNFRCFSDHKIPLRSTTVIVGRNNAGKSTIVEALRLVSIVENRYQSLNFSPVPDWLDIPLRNRGVRPSLMGMEFNERGIFHAYGEPPAVITAEFTTGAQIQIYVGEDAELFGVILDPQGRPIVTKGQAQRFSLPDVSILPQVGPLAREETILNADYVRRALSSSLAPLHFRNQLNLLYEHFPKFCQLAESTWPGLRVQELEGQGQLPELPLSLLLRDNTFVAEVAWMGHGLQMWLQTMWFLARTGTQHSVILDEPDVYMHADLQRRLIRLLRGRFAQTIVATHSVEILAEVSPDDVLVVDRARPESTFAATLPAVQNVVEKLGGVHNLQLSRLWSSRRCLLLEGEDLSFLKQFQDRLFPDSEVPLDAIPHMSIGGWSGWGFAVGSSMILRNAVGQEIRTYCILDSDYHTPTAVEKRIRDARQRGLEIHIWRRKEIENYLLVPTAIQRVIAERARTECAPSVHEIVAKLDDIAEELRQSVYEAMTDEYLLENRASGTAAAMRLAKNRLDAAWQTHSGRMQAIPGKETLSALSKWSQDTYGVAFGTVRIARELRRDELDAEVVDVITAIESADAFVS